MLYRLAATALAAVIATGTLATAAFTPTAHAESAATDSDQPVTDTWITTKVKAELATTEGVESTGISVKTVNGTVILIGVLPTKEAVDKAIAAARSVKGVQAVDDSGLKVK